MAKQTESINVRLVFNVKTGSFSFTDECYMHRSVERSKYFEWVEATKTQRKALQAQLSK